MGISELVVGATIIALGTSLPEIAVTAASLATGARALSLGNIVGSNITNIGLIAGLSILFFPVRIGTTKTQRNNFIFLLFTLLFLSLYLLPHNGRQILATVLFIFSFIFIALEFIWGERGRAKEDRTLLKTGRKKLPLGANLLGTVFALGALVISSKYLVSSSLVLASVWHLDQEIIGLTLVAVGTSLPELATSLWSGIKRNDKLLLGDLQGSNILNLSLLGTLVVIAGDGTGWAHTLSLGYLFFFSAILFGLVEYYRGRTIPKIFGATLVASYGLYLTQLY